MQRHEEQPVRNTHYTAQQEQDIWKNRAWLVSIAPVMAQYSLNGAASIQNLNEMSSQFC